METGWLASLPLPHPSLFRLPPSLCVCLFLLPGVRREMETAAWAPSAPATLILPPRQLQVRPLPQGDPSKTLLLRISAS